MDKNKKEPFSPDKFVGEITKNFALVPKEKLKKVKIFGAVLLLSGIFVGIMIVINSGDKFNKSASAVVTYYVDCTSVGNDANSGTSQTLPWRTLAKANQALLNPGDSLLLKRDCVWNETLNLSRSGTASSNIIVADYGTGSLPTIKRNTHGTNDVYITGSYITIQNIYVTATPPSVISSSDTVCPNQPTGYIAGFVFASGASFNTVKNSKATGLYAGVFLKLGSHNNRILQNDLSGNNLMNPDTPTSVNGNDDAGAFGVNLQGDDNEIAYNAFSNNIACSYDYGKDGSSVEIYGGQRNNIHHNQSINELVFSELGNSRSADNVFAYNLMSSTQIETVFLNTRGSGTTFGPVLRTKAYNNTVYLTASNSQGIICSNCYDANSTALDAVLSAKNNIIWANWKAVYTSQPFEESNNIYWKTGGSPLIQGFTIASTSKKVDPLFVSTGSNFHLQSTSPAVNTGTNLGYVSDLDGNVVPTGAAPDMGVYEYGSAPPNPPPPPPSGLQNTSFENTGTTWLSPWIFDVKTGAAGSISQDSTTKTDGNYSAKIDVTTSAPTSPWLVQLRQENQNIVSGQNYNISFWAKASVARNIEVKLQSAVSPYPSYLTQSVALTTSWQQYTLAYTPTVSDTNTFFGFNLAQTTGSLWIDQTSFGTGVLNTAPSISGCTASPASITTQQSVTYTVTGSDPQNDPIYYSISWGDTTTSRLPSTGTVASGVSQNSSKTYDTAGTYTPTVIVTDSSGLQSSSFSCQSVVVSNPTLTAVLSSNPTSGIAPVTISLTVTVSGTTIGTINYHFDCTNDGTYEQNILSTNINPYTTTNVCTYSASGTYTAKVWVERGTGSTIATTSVSVSASADITAPSVSITFPLNGASVTRGSTITITSTATDNVGVARVEFYINGTLKCTDSTSPYSCSWRVPSKPSTPYTINAKAYDSAGNAGQATINVTSL